MKLSIFRLFFLFFFLSVSLYSSIANAQDVRVDTVYVVDTVYIKDPIISNISPEKERYIMRWYKLIPSYFKVQFAGGMGLISAGAGWNYGKNKQWETDWLFGFVPKYSTQNNKVTMTIKQNFIPWKVYITDNINLKPFSTGLYANTIFGSHFWGKQPSKYPNGYYGFSPKIRFNIFIGQAWEYKLNTSKNILAKSITFFYEISSNELYIISAFNNSYLKPKDYLGLSLGLKMQIM